MTAKEVVDLINNRELELNDILKVHALPFYTKYKMVQIFLNKFIKLENNKISYDSALLYRGFKQVFIETYYDVSLSETDEDQLTGYDWLEMTGLLREMLDILKDEYEDCLEILEYGLQDLQREKLSLEAIVDKNLNMLVQIVEAAIDKFANSNKDLFRNMNIEEIMEAYKTLNETGVIDKYSQLPTT